MNTRYIVALLVVLAVVAGAVFVANRDKGSKIEGALATVSSNPQVSLEDKESIEAFVDEFGSKLKNVSLLASPKDLAASFEEYSRFVSPELLSLWKSEPARALGRTVSSPWPESMNVASVSMDKDGAYLVEADVIEVTSASGKEPVAIYPVKLRIEKREGNWTIVGSEKGEYSKLPERITVVGKRICLSHKDTTGPQTLECALGIKGDDGKTYALDMSKLTSTTSISIANTANRLRIEGVFTPVEMLNTDAWQKYDMSGILSAVTIVKQ